MRARYAPLSDFVSDFAWEAQQDVLHVLIDPITIRQPRTRNAPELKMKLNNWRGFRGINGLKCSPVLVFRYQFSFWRKQLMC